MKIDEFPRWPQLGPDLVRFISEQWRRMAGQANALAEGRIDAAHEAKTAAPTAGTYATGDWVRNKTPSEAGTAGSKYVVTGWVCVAGGTPGTWVATRSLTGN